MRQKVLVIAHDSYNEYDRPYLLFVSWSDAQILCQQTIELPQFKFNEWSVTQEIVSTEEICLVDKFDVPPFISLKYERELMKKIQQMNQELYPNPESGYDKIKLLYSDARNMDEHRVKIVARFKRVCTDDEWEAIRNKWIEKYGEAHPILIKKEQDYIITVPKTEKHTYDNGAKWFSELQEPIQDICRKWYNNKEYPTMEECVEAYIQAFHPEFDIVNIIYT